MVDTMAGNQERRIEICENDGDVASKLCDYVINKANESVKKRGIFTIGLSGELAGLNETGNNCIHLLSFTL